MDPSLKISSLATEPIRGRRDQKKLENRGRIYDTAIRLFGERGYDKVSADDIAQEAGVSRATVFNYFPSKADFLSAYTEEYLEVVLGYWDTVAHLPPVARLDTMARLMGREAEQRRRFLDLLSIQDYTQGPERLRLDRQKFQAVIERLCQTIEEGKAAGEIRPELDTSDITAMVEASYNSVFMERMLTGEDLPVGEMIRRRYGIARTGIVTAEFSAGEKHTGSGTGSGEEERH